MISVEISRRDEAGGRTNPIVCCPLKSSVAVSEKNADIAAASVGYSEIWLAIIVEVANRHRKWVIANHVLHGVQETARLRGATAAAATATTTTVSTSGIYESISSRQSSATCRQSQQQQSQENGMDTERLRILPHVLS